MYRTSHLNLASILLIFSGVRGASKYRSSQVENRGKRRNTAGRGHCFGGSARFEWDMATDIGTYQGGNIGRHTPISLPCAEDEWHVVGLHTYEVAQEDKIAAGTTRTRGPGVGSRIVGERPLRWPRMHDNNG
jgi:hypothetical protein